MASTLVHSITDHPSPPVRAWTGGCTASGRRYYPQDPRPQDFDIHDIAHALSQQCRFGGHTSQPYSVAEHCVHVSYECCTRYALDGLLHDAPEAYLVDVPRPVKYAPGMEGYVAMEAGLMGAMAIRFMLVLPPGSYRMPACVKRADEQMLATEARDLMPQDGPGGVRGWTLEHLPLPHLSVACPWSPAKARRRFLRRYRELTWNLTWQDRVVIAVRKLLGMEGCR